MNVEDAIRTRRSIRTFKDEPVPEELLVEIVDAARLAPSGSNKQGARYHIICDKKQMDLLKREAVFPQGFVTDAPAMIVCIYSESAYPKNDDPVYGTDGYTKSIRDLGISSSFLVLRATELGLGTCWIGLMDKGKMKAILGLEDDMHVLFSIIVGYPGETKEPTPRISIDEVLV